MASPVPSPESILASPRAEDLASSPLGEPAPETVPVVLRPAAVATTATLVDLVTQRVLEVLERSLHTAVATAVRSLAPAMTIRLAADRAPPNGPPVPVRSAADPHDEDH